MARTTEMKSSLTARGKERGSVVTSGSRKAVETALWMVAAKAGGLSALPMDEQLAMLMAQEVVECR